MSKNATGNKVSLLSAVFFSATCMVGSGWLFSAQMNARLAGNWGFIAWIIAAVMILLVGLCYTTVVGCFPVRGVMARAGSLSHNHIFGMPFAFANWFGVLVVIPTEAQATTQYLASAIGSPALINHHGLMIGGKLLAVGILGIYFLINYYGIKMLSCINNVVTAFKVFTPLFVIAIFLIAAFGPAGHGNENLTLFRGDFSMKSAFMAVIGAGLIYSFNGFQIILAFASEIKNPKRNIPLAMVLSVLVILVLYLVLQYAFMSAIPQGVLTKCHGWKGLNFASPLLNVAMLLGFNFITLLLLVDSVISPSGTGYTYLGAVTRMTSGMSKERQFPAWLGEINPAYNFSRRSLIFNGLLALTILWFADSWASLMLMVTGYHIIGYMSAPLSMGAISVRKRLVGAIVFLLLGLLLYTLKLSGLLLMNISLTVLLVIYGFLQVDAGLRKLVVYALPFIFYLWLCYLFHNVYVISAVSVTFYYFATSPAYVLRCKRGCISGNSE